jgi:GNAT superfamily N-acetyltransferase
MEENYTIRKAEQSDASSHQGRGVGRQLIAALKPELAQLGAKSLEVTSNKKRKEAHAFYQSVGFLNSHEKFTIYF